MRRIALLSFFVFVLSCSELHAAGVLDQSFVRFGGYASVSSAWAQAQTFTAGISGELVRIEAALVPAGINLYNTADVNLLVVRPQNQFPNVTSDNVIAITSAHFPNPNFEIAEPSYVPPFQWVQFDLPNVPIHNGDYLAMVLESADDHGYQWAADFQSNYSRGDGYWGPPDAFMHPTGDDQRDYLFRTYVAPVPEPSTFFLLGIGAISLLGYRKAKSPRF